MLFEILNENKVPQEPNITGVKFIETNYKHKGINKIIYNSILVKNGKNYRVRVETLIFNKNGQVLLAIKDKLSKYGISYKLPGGSVEPNTKPSTQAKKECEEELKAEISNIRYTGLEYTIMLNRDEEFKKFKNYIPYHGYISYIFVADYEGKYQGEIDEIDEEPDFVRSAKFYDIGDIKWRKEHKQAIQFHNEKIFETPEQFNSYLNGFEYGYYLNGENALKYDENFIHYKTISPENFIFWKCGICWDYVEYEAYYFQKYLNYKVTTDELKNKTFSMYYMQHSSADNCNPTHTWLGYMDDDKIYSFESSWKSIRGVKEFKTESEMINYYISQQLKYYSKTQGKTYLNRVTVIKYTPFKEYNLNCDKYMDTIIDNGKVVRSDFKEIKINYIINDHLYFYHLLPKSNPLDKYGLISLEFMYNNRMYQSFDKSVEKYKYRLIHGWDVYPNKKESELTREDIINGLRKIRGKDGLNQIYFFRYPPYKELGLNMTNTLNGKYIYRIDLKDPETLKYIKGIDWGTQYSKLDGKRLDRDYYEKISIEEYYNKYNDNEEMRFAKLNHISIIPKQGFLPIHILQPIKIPISFNDICKLEYSTSL